MSSLLSDVSGAPLTPAVLSKALRGAAACEIVPGTELKQPGSHTALLRDVANPTSTVFLKKVTAAFVGNKGWIDRRRVLLYIRNELRFYDEFGDALRARGVALPRVHHLEAANLDGLEEQEHEPPAELLASCGALMFIEPFVDAARYEQTSPLTLEQATALLYAAAKLHAAAWEDRPLLERAAARLQRHGGSFALSARNPDELRDLPASWSAFVAAFTPVAPAGFFARAEIATLGQRLQAAAPWIAEQLSPSPRDAHATLVHGDLKAMNAFLPVPPAGGGPHPDGGDAVLIDFASTGVGFGMADVAMHLVHALAPSDLDGGGEEALVEAYLCQLRRLLGGRRDAPPYPRELALRHYRLGVCDYGRFVMGRFWATASPERFEKVKGNANVVLANRNLASALRFVERISACLGAFEDDMHMAICAE